MSHYQPNNEANNDEPLSFYLTSTGEIVVGQPNMSRPEPRNFFNNRWGDGHHHLQSDDARIPAGLIPIDRMAHYPYNGRHRLAAFPNVYRPRTITPSPLQYEQAWSGDVPIRSGTPTWVQITDDGDNLRRGFGRASNKGPNVPKQGNAPSPTNFSQPPMSASQHSLAHSPALSPSLSNDTSSSIDNFNINRKQPFFFREQYANLIVKGNFMTLAAKPVLVEEGEWLAHQGKTN